MANTYADIIKRKKSDWNCTSLMDGAKAKRGKKIPFSSPLMNFCTYGGVPRNRITEFYGAPGSGKSTSCVDICKQAVNIFKQEHEDEIFNLRELASKGTKSASVELEDLIDRGPKKILYLDLEHGFDGKWSETLGIKESEIDVMQPPDVVAEDILQTVQELIETGEIGLLVLDSIPSLVPKSEIEKKFGERTVAALAGLLTVFCRKITPMLTRYGCTMIVINQLRDNMDNPYVDKTPGGQALKFYASLRILFKSGQPVDFLGNELPQNTENPAGAIVNAKITKQKTAPWDRKLGSYYLMYDSGIRADFDFAQLAIKKYGLILKSGAWYQFIDPYTGEIITDDTDKPIKVNGLSKVYDFLQSNEKYYSDLKKYILDDINGVKSEDNQQDENLDSIEEVN